MDVALKTTSQFANNSKSSIICFIGDPTIKTLSYLCQRTEVEGNLSARSANANGKRAFHPSLEVVNKHSTKQPVNSMATINSCFAS
jgi:hypothetical protein